MKQTTVAALQEVTVGETERGFVFTQRLTSDKKKNTKKTTG